MSSTGLNLIELELVAAQQKLKDVMDARDSMQSQVDQHNAEIAAHERRIADLRRDWAHLQALAAPMDPQPTPDPTPEPQPEG